MKILRNIYIIWVAIAFLSVFIIVLIPFWFAITTKNTRLGHKINVFWGTLAMWLSFLFYRIEYRYKPNKKDTYVYIANHASFIDIPMGFISSRSYMTIIGKASLGKVPLFGWMYRNIYITVDRKSKRDRFKSLEECKKAINEGRSVFIFPEGTIPRKNNPQMIPFKDGAFKLAIETGTPIVPMTFPYDWKALPDHDKLNGRPVFLKSIVHEKIETKGMTVKDIDTLKERCFNLINDELKKHGQI